MNNNDSWCLYYVSQPMENFKFGYWYRRMAITLMKIVNRLFARQTFSNTLKNHNNKRSIGLRC